MDGKLRIKISIADRVYPLTVEPTQEEGLRSASKKIDAITQIFLLKRWSERRQLSLNFG